MDFEVAKKTLETAGLKYPVGFGVNLPGEDLLRPILGLALHSETLETLLLVGNEGNEMISVSLDAVAPPARRITDRATLSRSGRLFRHRKGGEYELLFKARLAGQSMVAYQEIGGNLIWLRPEPMFFDGRFTERTSA